MSLSSAAGRLTAVLGPTNTGKTYLAIERMLGHESGMIGFPLRLLARENYDRIVQVKGASQVALITGEEKIAPPGARYFVCTVESMPLDRTVSFLAVDEVQMAADPERGHFFTDRLLHARGTHETMLLGADTIRPVLNRLLPDIDVVARPRFSKLTYVGPKKATRLPRRSAVVGFSASEVYAIAELIRRQRGGTAIVMGAMSPRTRNAQVDMFQSGEVDYLVATDAIGMGLNMDVNHVWFASLRKYDGRSLRPLRNVELAQIAGRAGRHMNDGTFGTTADVGGLEPEVVEAIENHRFDPLRDVAMAQQRPRFPLGAGADRLAQPAAAACRAAARARAGRSARPADPVGAIGFPAAPAHAAARQAALGSLPGAGLPQDDDRGAHAAARPALRASDAGRRAPARGLDRKPRQAAGTLRRRHRHADGAHRPCPDVDLHFASSRLDPARSALAGARTRHRGQAFRRAAPASDAKVCR